MQEQILTSKTSGRKHIPRLEFAVVKVTAHVFFIFACIIDIDLANSIFLQCHAEINFTQIYLNTHDFSSHSQKPHSTDGVDIIGQK